jgi:chromosome segregation ATPase
MKSKMTLFSLLTIGFIACCCWLSAQAQQNRLPETAAAPETQMLNQILTEVRQLRATVQRSGQSIYRGQILLEQLRTQQEKVARLSGQIEELRNQQTQFRAQQPQMQERLRSLESEINSETNAARRTQLEAEANAMRQFFDGLGKDEQQIQERERQLTTQLLTEQATLDDLTRQLKTIEESLDSLMGSPSQAKSARAR